MRFIPPRIFLLLVVITIAAADPVSYRVTVYYQGGSKNEDVTIDVNQEYAIVTNNADCNDGQFSSTINYHDYRTGYLAMKNIETKDCVVTKNSFKMEDTLKKIQNAMNNVHEDLVPFDMDCSMNKRFDVQEAREYFGPRIEAFCNTYRIIYAETTPAKEEKAEEQGRLEGNGDGKRVRVKRARKKKGKKSWCFICINTCKVSSRTQ